MISLSLVVNLTSLNPKLCMLCVPPARGNATHDIAKLLEHIHLVALHCISREIQFQCHETLKGISYRKQHYINQGPIGTDVQMILGL